MHCLLFLSKISLWSLNAFAKPNILIPSLPQQMKISLMAVKLWHDWNKSHVSFLFRDHQQPIRDHTRGGHQSWGAWAAFSSVQALLQPRRKALTRIHYSAAHLLSIHTSPVSSSGGYLPRGHSWSSVTSLTLEINWLWALSSCFTPRH